MSIGHKAELKISKHRCYNSASYEYWGLHTKQIQEFQGEIKAEPEIYVQIDTVVIYQRHHISHLKQLATKGKQNSLLIFYDGVMSWNLKVLYPVINP